MVFADAVLSDWGCPIWRVSVGAALLFFVLINSRCEKEVSYHRQIHTKLENGCPFIDECDGIFALRNLNFTRLLETLANANIPIISDRARFSDASGFDVAYNASYKIGDNYCIDEEGLIVLREELTIIYATLYCWLCGAEAIFWIGADGEGLDVSDLREMSSAISGLKSLGINVATLSESVYDLPFICHWKFYE